MFLHWLEEKAGSSAAVTQEVETLLPQDIWYVLYIHNPSSHTTAQPGTNLQPAADTLSQEQNQNQTSAEAKHCL